MENKEKEVFEAIKKSISVISILQSRAKKLNEELNFVKQKKEEIKYLQSVYFLSAICRLKHEFMFLVIDTYSLHEGLAKQKSLYARIIQNNGKSLSKVSKSTNDNIMYLGEITESDDGKIIHIHDNNQEKEIIRALNKFILQERKLLKNKKGITSENYYDIEKWFNKITCKDSIDILKKYRDNFSHRFDEIEKIKSRQDHNIDIHNDIQEMDRIHEITTEILKRYYEALNTLLIYTKATSFLGVTNFKYCSISQLK